MAENSAENGGEILQQPQFEVPASPAEGQEKQTERALEQQQAQETIPAKQTPQFPTPDPTSTLIATPQQETQKTDNPSVSSQATAGMAADDVDLIEKQWVERAKNIIAQTQDDPRKQKDEINKVKVEYIKKRFNKSIPVDDSAKP